MNTLRKFVGLVIIFLVVGAGSAMAGDTDIMKQPQNASEPVGNRIIQPEVKAPMEEDGDLRQFNEYITLSGAIELEAASGEDFEGNNFSELNLATAEIGLNIQMSEWAKGYLLTAYDEEDDQLFIDEATIELGNGTKFPLFMTAGKFCMPFGYFETSMVQDPLTLDVGEIRAEGVSVGFEQSGFYGAVYGYDGINQSGSDNTIEGFGAQAGYRYEKNDLFIDGGVSWVHNIADSGGISDVFDENGLKEINDEVPGLGVHLMTAYGPISIIGEYTRAMDKFEESEIPYNTHGAEPKAWSSEFAYTIDLYDLETVFAIGYQGTREAVNLGLPESRMIGAVGINLLEGVTVTVEYFYDDDYPEDDGGTGNSAGTVTTRLAYEF